MYVYFVDYHILRLFTESSHHDQHIIVPAIKWVGRCVVAGLHILACSMQFPSI